MRVLFRGWYLRSENSARLLAFATLVLAMIAGPGLTARGAAPAQQAQAKDAKVNPQNYAFEVVSIKPGLDSTNGWGWSFSDDGFTAKNMSLLNLVKYAYETFQDDRIIGAPKWIDSANYVIQAKIDPDTLDAIKKLPRNEQHRVLYGMVRAMLADRFQLTVHDELKEFPVFFLMVGKDGPKLTGAKPKPGEPDNAYWGRLPDGRNTTLSSTKVTTMGRNIAMEDLAKFLTSYAGRTVIDKTNLTGKYDVQLIFTPANAPPDLVSNEQQAPSLRSVLAEQLGLRLEPGKASLEVIVIDQIERASAN